MKLFNTILFLSACLFSLISSSVFAEVPVPHHHIALHISIAKQLVIGSSKISIPPRQSLNLNFGPLTVTGISIETAGQTPYPLKISSKNTLSLPPAEEEQHLYLSWQLHVPEVTTGNNLISATGITLAGFWHPQTDKDTLFSLQTEIPATFTAITEAEKISVVEQHQIKAISTSFAHPLRTIHFIAGPYTVHSRKLPGLSLYGYFFKEDQILAEEYLDKAEKYLTRYQDEIGPYPYSRYSIVENRLPTGFAMPTFTLLGQAVLRLPFIKDTSLGHEILHSWFGNSVFIDPLQGNWCEGLVTYLADQQFARDKGNGTNYRKNQLIRYNSYIEDANSLPLAGFHGSGGHSLQDQKTRSIGYDRSSMFFHMLRNKIGRENFTAGLRSFYQKNRYKRAGWTELEEAFTRASSINLSSFFREWVHQPGTPEIYAKDVNIKQQEGKTVVSFTLGQQSTTPFDLNIPITFETLQGPEKNTYLLNTMSQEFEQPLTALPTTMTLDPEYELMRKLAPEETPPVWSSFLGSKDKRVLIEDLENPVYQDLLVFFNKMGSSIHVAAATQNSELASGDWIFLGNSNSRSSLFASSNVPEAGFSLDVRHNPLNPLQVIVLLDASPSESKPVINKLRHYGKYSKLYFKGGKIGQKSIQPTQMLTQPLITKPNGTPANNTLDFESIIKDLNKSQIVYVGETHTNYGDHLLQLQILQALHRNNKNLAIGLEMFPRSSQKALDNYINGNISNEKDFIKTSRYFDVWGYDYRHYRDIIAYAKAHRLSLIALNQDKDITREIYKSGNTDGLSREQQANIPLARDLDLPGYRQRLQPIHQQHSTSPHQNLFSGFIQAQALWDETMAESIVNFLQNHPQRQMLVIAGTGHVLKASGIPPRVERRLPSVEQRVVLAEDNAQDLAEIREQLDYRMQSVSINLEPAAKIGVVIDEEKSEQGATLKVLEISPTGKAQEAGIQKNDILTAIGQTKVTSIADLRIALMDHTPGDTIQLQLRRDSKTITCTLELSAPQRPVMPPEHPK